MELFDKKYVYLEWDDVLQGKDVFIADTLPELRRRIIKFGSTRWLVRKHDGDYPFVVEGSYVQYAMVYYDPNYNCKRAYMKGKQIQYKSKDSSEPWIDCFKEPSWCADVDYRVKPEENTCNSCQYQCTPDTENPCMTCIGYGNYKPRVVVKPKHNRRMTNRELAQWVAGGWGECLQNTIAFTSWNYLTENKDKTVSDGIKIRGWDETEWREPEIEE